MKKILVTGGSGFIGTNLLNRLSKFQNVKIRSTIYSKKPIIESNNIEYIRVDLTNREKVRHIYEDIDVVIMGAAVSSGANVMASNPLIHLNDNILMNTIALEEAHKNNVGKFIFISSNTVYPLSDDAVKESDALFNFYKSYHIVAWMKRFTEVMCDMYANKIKNPMKTIILRPGNLYGPHDKFDWEKSKVVPALIRKCIENDKSIEVWGDGKDIKDFLYIDDFIDALIKIIFDFNDSDIFNVASGSPVTINKIIKNILNIVNKNSLLINYDETKPSMIPIRKINIDKIVKNIDWHPSTSMITGLEKTINWYKNYYKSFSPEGIKVDNK